MNTFESFDQQKDVLEACQELSRLLNHPDTVSPNALIHIFANPKLRAQVELPGATLAELVARFATISSTITDRPAEEHRLSTVVPSTELMARGIQAFWKWARVGFGVVSPAIYAHRVRSCTTCEYYVDVPEAVLYSLAKTVLREAKICDRCGCFISKKARAATENCPVSDPLHPGLSYWGEPLIE